MAESKMIDSFSNLEDGVTAIINYNGNSYGVSLRDDDSGLFVPLNYIRIKTLDEAIRIAKKSANIMEVSNE